LTYIRLRKVGFEEYSFSGMSTHHGKRRAQSPELFDPEVAMLTHHGAHLDHVSQHPSGNVFVPVRDIPLRQQTKYSASLHEEVQKLAKEVLGYAEELGSTVQHNSLEKFLKNNKEKRHISKENEIKYTFFELALDIFYWKHSTSGFSFPIEGRIAMSELQTETYAHNFLGRFLGLCEKLNDLVISQSQIVSLVEHSSKGIRESMRKRVEHILYLGILGIREKSGEAVHAEMEELADKLVQKIKDMSQGIKGKAENSGQLREMARYYERHANSGAAYAIKFALYSSALEQFTRTPSYAGN
jgi:hypothetical protein